MLPVLQSQQLAVPSLSVGQASSGSVGQAVPLLEVPLLELAATKELAATGPQALAADAEPQKIDESQELAPPYKDLARLPMGQHMSTTVLESQQLAVPLLESSQRSSGSSGQAGPLLEQRSSGSSAAESSGSAGKA